MAQSRTNETQRLIVESAYKRLKDDAFVAFVDESYVAPENAHGSKTFYIATAYVAQVKVHAGVRSDRNVIVGGTYWHTSESHAAGDSAKIQELCKYISDAGESEAFLLAIKTPIANVANTDEKAREECLTALLSQLHLGQLVPRPQLVVAEERRHGGQRNADERTIKAIRRQNLIGTMRVLFTSSSVESLLWVPDIVSFAQNHSERGIDTGYVEELEEMLHIIPV